MSRISVLAVVAYGVAALVTFGHAAASADAWKAEKCKTVTQRLLRPDDGCYAPSALIGIAGGVAWPLYWSWEFWS